MVADRWQKVSPHETERTNHRHSRRHFKKARRDPNKSCRVFLVFVLVEKREKGRKGHESYISPLDHVWLTAAHQYRYLFNCSSTQCESPLIHLVHS